MPSQIRNRKSTKIGSPRIRSGRLNMLIMGQVRKARKITKITIQSSFAIPSFRIIKIQHSECNFLSI
jgi:hypothetical protein